MKQEIDTLRGYVNDMLAVERDIHAAFRRHKDDREAHAFGGEATLATVRTIPQITNRVSCDGRTSA